ncbi:uncharacterized protein KY384_007441 [Bacidia gigantensis]|uniref:uncharacterized protein n=1 Tax=Bacidia gigantensis TaxID=2732470 RepID=UPI001D047D32|nr:uncharacterized protein KY384_007441 [Bacidia gigantensis]KAG8528523.1 hypothetical protein KY384_007441 [Bacidia gigantensis]
MSIIEHAKIDMYDFLPIPFGLVRFGVAPDHPEVKVGELKIPSPCNSIIVTFLGDQAVDLPHLQNCQERFSEVASSPNFNFIGNIDVGKSLTLKKLKGHYNAILFAYGASQDRKLEIPGEDGLKGIYSARHYVGWYNGLPEHAELSPDLSTGDTAVVIGQGNVALDVARTLLTNIDVLRKTDMTDRALSVLSKSRIKRAAFTIKELRELLHLPEVSFSKIDPSLLPPPENKLPRTPRRMVNLLREGSTTPSDMANRSWSFDFMQSPRRFVGHESRRELKQVDFEENRFQELSQRFEPSARLGPTTRATTNSITTSIAFRSIGYKSVPIDGMQELSIRFNAVRGIIPNDGYGRILDHPDSSTSSEGQGDALPGLYCAGWVKRGPAGVIANTMEDAFATAEAIAKDWESAKPFFPGGEGWDILSTEVAQRGLRTVSWMDWLKIDEAEKTRGKAAGKEREKFTTISEMLSVLD